MSFAHATAAEDELPYDNNDLLLHRDAGKRFQMNETLIELPKSDIDKWCKFDNILIF
jgi:hypothetical protein